MFSLTYTKHSMCINDCCQLFRKKEVFRKKEKVKKKIIQYLLQWEARQDA